MLTYLEPFMNKSILLFLFLAFSGSLIFAQQGKLDSLIEKAEKARLEYKFSEAISLFKEATTINKDSVLNQNILTSIAKCENGLSMLEFGIKPIVSGSITLSSRDFFLYYEGMADNSWSQVPLNLSKSPSNESPRSIVFLRGDEKEIIFSGKNKFGKWKLFSIKKIAGNKWSYPSAINELSSSSGNEIFPFLSSDGSQLYFSSDGLYGMGGYDLYVSTFDKKTGQWETPQNLGFPFSSPKNDYLFVNTDNNKFTYLASDRDLKSTDSVKVYQLERDITPVKRSFSNYSEILLTASLSSFQNSNTNQKEEKSVENIKDTIADEYSAKVLKVREIQAEIDKNIKTISTNRSLYESLTNDADKKLLEKKIEENELKLISLQSDLRTANMAVQKSEMEFLQKGMLAPRLNNQQTSNIIANNADHSKFTPSRMNLGKFPDLVISEPILPFNYSFRIETNSQLYPIDSIANGITFTIQLVVSSNRADNKILKGISPVFEDITSTGKYVYYCGAYSTYDAAFENLAKIKKAGFPGAILAAFNNKSVISTKQARTLADTRDKNKGYRITLDRYYENGLPQEYIDIIRQNCEKDIVKTTNDGRIFYFVGTFLTRTEAEKILFLLKTAGAEGVNMEEFKLQ